MWLTCPFPRTHSHLAQDLQRVHPDNLTFTVRCSSATLQKGHGGHMGGASPQEEPIDQPDV